MERRQKRDETNLRQYQVGDMSAYKTTRSAIGDKAKSLERYQQLESFVANRKHELGIAFEWGRRLDHELAFSLGIELGRGLGIGILSIRLTADPSPQNGDTVTYKSAPCALGSGEGNDCFT